MPVHRRSVPSAEVEIIARVLRKFDIDGVIDEEAAKLGEMVIKVSQCVLAHAVQVHVLTRAGS